VKLVTAALFALALRGDTVELKTGEHIEGVFKQASSAGTVIEVGGQVLTIPLERVRTIYFGTAPVRAATAPTDSQEAMDALKALRSVTTTGIAYRDYTQRMLDAKVKVDKYLASPADDSPQLRGAIRVAMLEYELASQSWLVGSSSSPIAHADLWEPMGKILEDPEVAKCPVAARAVRTAGRTDAKSLGLSLVLLPGGAPGDLWPCASQQIAEAERLIAQR
jgi:hypothetical protein